MVSLVVSAEGKDGPRIRDRSYQVAAAAVLCHSRLLLAQVMEVVLVVLGACCW